MKFLYKIWSGYDDFEPSAIPSRRRLHGGRLRLGWGQYLDAVEADSEIWVYFFGPHRFRNGVYVKGVPDKIDRAHHAVFLRVRDFSLEEPLTDHATSARIAEVVRPATARCSCSRRNSTTRRCAQLRRRRPAV
jgi:hypothetical protein